MRKMYYFKVGDIVETLSKSSKGLITRIEGSNMYVMWLEGKPSYGSDVQLYGTEYAHKFLKPIAEV
jgi:hypothetical protein